MADPVLSLQIDSPSTAAAKGYLILDDATHGLLGTGTLAPDVIYDEKITYARTISTKRGVSQFNAPLFRSEAGTLSAVLDNRTRVFDPAVASDIVPGRAVQCQATYNASTYSLFTGVIHDWTPEYPGQSQHGDAITTISANDGFAQLASLNVNETRPSEPTGRRINALANILGWPISARLVSRGVTTMPSAGQTVSALAALQEAADSEMGELYVEGDGTLTFRDRDAIVTAARSATPQATFGDAGGVELKFASPRLGYSDSQVLNEITLVYNQQGDSVTASDGTSQAQYGIWSQELQVRITEPNVAADYASFLVSLFAQPIPNQIDSIVIRPFRDPTNLFPQVLGRLLGDRISVKFQPPGGGARITHDCFIRGISHDFSAVTNARDWTTTFALQDASAWPGSVFIIGTSNLNSSDILWW